MDPITALILGGVGASVAGTGMGLGFLGQSVSNEFSAREARRQRRWMERMSKTQHQRQVEDMRKAGLNPILSATGGSGASVGTPASPSSAPLNLPSLSEALSTTMGLYTSAKQAEKTGADTALAVAQADNVNTATRGQILDNEIKELTKISTVAKSKADAAIAQGNAKTAKEIYRKAIFEADKVQADSELRTSSLGKMSHSARLFREFIPDFKFSFGGGKGKGKGKGFGGAESSVGNLEGFLSFLMSRYNLNNSSGVARYYNEEGIYPHSSEKGVFTIQKKSR